MFKRNWTKYNATKTIIDWYTFRSKLEARVYEYLKYKYNIIEHEPVFELQAKFEYEWKKYREIKYKSDFLIELPNFEKLLIEAKWFEVPEWKLKKKLFLFKMKDFEKEFDCKIHFIICKSIKDLEKQLLIFNK